MQRISLLHLARNKPIEPLLEKEVQMRAYELYEQRGRVEGFALHDWLQAEAEVLNNLSNSLPSSSTFVNEV